jgi:hypothetical protein
MTVDEPKRLEQFPVPPPGSVLCGMVAGRFCNRELNHEGRTHAEISYSGLVLEVWQTEVDAYGNEYDPDE